MSRRIRHAAAAIAALAVGAGCAEQTADRGSAAAPAATFPVRSADDESWVGPQVDPGLDSSWAGPQVTAGLNSSWVGVQVDPGLDSSWAGPQVTAAQEMTATTAAPTTIASPTSEPAATSTSLSPAAGESGFVPASPEVAGAVTAAIGRTEAAYDAAVRDLSNPALRDALAATTVDGSAAEQLFLGWYDLVVTEGYSYESATDGENVTTLLPGMTVTLAENGREAVTYVCSASGDTISIPVDPDTTDPNAVEVVISSGWTAYVQMQVFVLNEATATWLLSDVIDLESHPGEKSCEEDVPSSSVSSVSSPAA